MEEDVVGDDRVVVPAFVTAWDDWDETTAIAAVCDEGEIIVVGTEAGVVGDDADVAPALGAA